MKKSTLITTIAMIVVVVVALSTATYAWFSASSVSTATVQMTTSATSDWMIFTGAAGSSQTNTKSYTFTTAASEAITLTPTGLQAGLKAPSSQAFANSIAIDGTQAVATSQEFLAAKKGSSVTVEGAPAVYDPYVIKVSNATGADDKRLKLTVVINAGASQTTGTLYAAAATVFDISYITTKSGASATPFRKSYSMCTTKAGGYSDGDTVTASTPAVTSSSFASGSSPSFEYNVATAMSNVTNTYTNFFLVGENATEEEIAWGLQPGDYYLAYSVIIDDIDKTDSVYFSIYAWIDGWQADNSAGGASYKINFAFTTAEAATPSNSEPEPGQGD